MTDGIYTCDVDDYMWLLSKQDGKTTTSHQDWFYWWLADNGIDYNRISKVTYNELQGSIYVEELNIGGAVKKIQREGDLVGWRLKQRKRAPMFVCKEYPVVEDPPDILLDRWDWLMEEIRGSEREVGAAA